MELKDCHQLLTAQVGHAEAMFGTEPLALVAIELTYSLNSVSGTLPQVIMSAQAARSIAAQLLESAALAEAARTARPAH